MPGLAIIILYRSDEDNLEKCLKSVVQITDEIYLLDPATSSKAKELTRDFKIQYKYVKGSLNADVIENTASESQNDLIFFLYGYEYLSPSLRESILEIKQNSGIGSYRINRLFNYYGRWMRHSGLYPDQPLRLYKKRSCRWIESDSQPVLEMDPSLSCKLLNGDLYCIKFNSIQQHIDELNNATEIQANLSYEKGMKANILHFVFIPFYQFFRQYFVKLGFLDGYYGLINAVLKAFSHFLILTKLRNFWRSLENKGSD